MSDRVRCRNCGAQPSAQAKFCSECGHPLSQAKSLLSDRADDSPSAPQIRPSSDDPGHGLQAPAARSFGTRKLILLIVAVLILAGGATAIALVAAGGGTSASESTDASADPAATVEEPEDIDGDGIPDADDPDPYAAEGSGSDGSFDDGPTQDDGGYNEEPETDQKRAAVGEAVVDDDVTFKVRSIRSVAAIPHSEYSEPIVRKPGTKLVQVDLTWKNNMNTPADLFCGGAPAVLLDVDDRNFDPMDNVIEIAGNDAICGEDVQPGFKQNVTLAFRLPGGTAVAGIVLWNSESEDDPDGEVSDIFVEVD